MSRDVENSNQKIDEALALLNEAAREKRDEFSRILTDKYSDLKDTLLDAVQRKKESLGEVRETVEETLRQSEDAIRESAAELEKEVRKNPWPFLGGAAAAALLLGFILGNSKR